MQFDERLTVSFETGSAMWIEEQAEQRGVPKSQVVRDAVAAERESDTDLAQTGDILARLDELESQVEQINKRQQEVTNNHPDTVVGRQQDANRPVGEEHKENRGDSDTKASSDSIQHSGNNQLFNKIRTYLTKHPPQPEQNEGAIIAAWSQLRDVEVAHTVELRELVDKQYPNNVYTGDESQWRSIERELEDLPGVKKEGDSKLVYAGDDIVLDKINE